MKRYTFNYSLKGRISFAPLFHVEVAATYQAAEDRVFEVLGPSVTIHAFTVQFISPAEAP